MKKVDSKRELRSLYQAAANRVVCVEVPTMNFLMVDGEGDPNTSPQYEEAMEALFSLSYTVKFEAKRGPMAIEYGVMPLEGLWWAEDMAAFSIGDKSKWKWTMMIMQPKFITRDLVDSAIGEVKKRKSLSAIPKVRFEAFSEGKVAQTMHIGQFSDEAPAVQRVHEFIESCGCKRSGKHHEIYLSDIRRADPNNWKTLIRQPMI